jgi:hypothetical protein
LKERGNVKFFVEFISRSVIDFKNKSVSQMNKGRRGGMFVCTSGLSPLGQRKHVGVYGLDDY